MVCGCFSGAVRFGYFLAKNVTINSILYINVLDDYLLDILGAHRSTTFIQDGVHCHNTKIRVMQSLDNNGICYYILLYINFLNIVYVCMCIECCFIDIS